jgi:hypothetical protein
MTRRILSLVGVLALLVGSALAQQTSISGRVTDASGAVVAGAKITANRTDGGEGYKAATNAAGAYQIPSIVASDYILSVEAEGFAKSEKRLTILIGQSLNIEFVLRPATTVSTVLVDSAAEVIDITGSAVAGEIDPEQTSKLPLNGNNWLQLGAQVPGIRVNAIDNAPLDRNSTGSFQIVLDGQQVTQTNEYSWKSEPFFSRDSIAEFQIVTNRFDATEGRSTLLVINAQTKTGTNATHGGAYGYFRNSNAGSAADPVAKYTLPYSDQLFGGTIGGAIQKDKFFYFGSYEGDRNPQTNVTISTVSGIPSTSNEDTVLTNKYLARFDYKINAKDSLSLRSFVDTLLNPTNSSSSWGQEKWVNNSYDIQLTYTHTFNANAVNNLLFGDTHNYYGQDVLYPATALTFPNASLGADIYAPTKQNQEEQSVHDDLFWIHGKHSVKLGAELFKVLEHGIYSMEQNGQASINAYPGQANTPLANLTWAQVFPNFFDATTWNLGLLNPSVTAYTQTFGDPHFRVPRYTFGSWIQDDWKLSGRLTVNLGLRYDNDFNTFNSHVTLPASWNIPLPTHGQNNEVAPRLGFAFDPKGNGKTSIRGGAGIFYGDIMGVFTKKSELINGQNWVTPSLIGTKANPINLAAPFGTETPAQIRANPLAWKQALQVLGPNIQFPLAVQTSIGVQRELVHGIAVSADYLHDRARHLPIGRESNVYEDPTTGWNENPAVYGRPNPLFASITLWSAPAQVQDIYDALLINVQKIRWHQLGGSAAYTYSREKDNDSANNPFNYNDWGPSSSDQRHTLNATANYQFKHGFRGGLIEHYGSGAAYATSVGTNPTGIGANVVQGLSNRAYCGADATFAGCKGQPVVKTYNPAQDNYLEAASGLDITKRDAFYGRPIQRVDANVARDFSFRDRDRVTLQLEGFNVLNHANYGAYTTSINNAHYGAPAASTDLAYYPRMLQFSARFAF